MGLLYFISYFAVVAAFAFVTLSLASGLLYVSELIEEHSRLAKIIGKRSIYTVLLLHIVLYFTDSLPLLQILFSMLCHVVYLQNFTPSWPNISLSSLSFVGSCALVIADHFIWFFYFAHKTSEMKQLRIYRGPVPELHGFTEIAAFFGICVWLSPLFLFLSLSANDNALPTSTVDPTSPNVLRTGYHQPPSRISLLRHILSFFAFAIPSFRAKPLRKCSSEDIIAPRSPQPPPSPFSYQPSSSTVNRYGAPPRSPGPQAQEIDAYLPPMTSFKLGPVPRRPSTDTQRQTVGDTLGPGIALRKPANRTDDSDPIQHYN